MTKEGALEINRGVRKWLRRYFFRWVPLNKRLPSSSDGRDATSINRGLRREWAGWTTRTAYCGRRLACASCVYPLSIGVVECQRRESTAVAFKSFWKIAPRAIQLGFFFVYTIFRTCLMSLRMTNEFYQKRKSVRFLFFFVCFFSSSRPALSAPTSALKRPRSNEHRESKYDSVKAGRESDTHLGVQRSGNRRNIDTRGFQSFGGFDACTKQKNVGWAVFCFWE